MRRLTAPGTISASSDLGHRTPTQHTTALFLSCVVVVELREKPEAAKGTRYHVITGRMGEETGLLKGLRWNIRKLSVYQVQLCM